jgi:hypothetical protein
MSAAGPYADSLAHLSAELGVLDLLLRREVARARAARPAAEPPEYRFAHITDGALDRLFDPPSRPAPTDLSELDAEIAHRRANIAARTAASQAAGRPLALPRLCELCGLGPAEATLVLLALAPELDTRYETIFAYLQDDLTRKRLGVSLALCLLADGFADRVAARRLLADSAPLLRLRLVELAEDPYDRRPTLLRRFLRLDDSVLRFLLGLPPESTSGLRLIPPPDDAPDPGVSAATRAALDALCRSLAVHGPPASIVHLTGPPDAPLKAAARALAWCLQRPLLMPEPVGPAPDAALAAACLRDALLWQALPVLPARDRPDSTAEAAAAQASERRFWSVLHAGGVGGIALGGADLLRFPAAAPLWRIPVAGPDAEERRALWESAVQGRIADADPARLAEMFPFAAARQRQAMVMAYTQATLRNPQSPTPVMADLVAAGRGLATPNLQRFAITITPRIGWSDLVLPDDRRRQLRNVVARVIHRRRVQQDWGFGTQLSRGRGVAVLLSGAPGTGKTMAAEVLAGVLSLELFQIDLSTVVSKYIGETEKQLGAIFAEAERSQCVLFFDECDGIFSKRTEVKDAHDRYANSEVNYLLQRLEQYEGIVLLATNFQKNIDEAFLRRLHDCIEFPFPDAAAREQIWRRQFPPQAPVEPGLDYAALAARYRLAGGGIRSAALYAAHLAAEDGDGAMIRTAHVLEGIHREFQKQGKLVLASDRGDTPALSARPA